MILSRCLHETGPEAWGECMLKSRQAQTVSAESATVMWTALTASLETTCQFGVNSRRETDDLGRGFFPAHRNKAIPYPKYTGCLPDWL